MIVSSIKKLLINERAMRSGKTQRAREDALTFVIEAAFNHASPSIRHHAARHLQLSHGIELKRCA